MKATKEPIAGPVTTWPRLMRGVVSGIIYLVYNPDGAGYADTVVLVPSPISISFVGAKDRYDISRLEDYYGRVVLEND